MYDVKTDSIELKRIDWSSKSMDEQAEQYENGEQARSVLFFEEARLSWIQSSQRQKGNTVSSKLISNVIKTIIFTFN
jgi:hypothetical protein